MGTDRPALLTVPSAPAAFHVLAKPTGAICNLDCEYCFFLAKEQLYPGSDFRMARQTQQRYLSELLAAHRSAAEVVVAWQGGEPTMMGLDFFRDAVAMTRALARPGQRILHTVQTNATLLDAQWARFLRDNDFLVGVSIDGPADLHDRYRVDKGGKPTFERVRRGLAELVRYGVQWNALTTVNAANGEHGRRVYRFLRDELGARFIQFIPIVERANPAELGGEIVDRSVSGQHGGQVTDRSIGAGQYGRFLIDVFEEWVRRDIGTVYVQMFDTALANWVGEPGGMCVHAPTCGTQVALEHNGDVYSCDHYVEPGYLLGNIATSRLLTLVASPRQVDFGQAKRDTLTRYCRDCPVRFACHGGCPKDRFATSPLGEPGHQYLCPSYRDFFGHVDAPMRAMAALLAAGRAPAELMAGYAGRDARRGRNEPCPCGTGRKWKTCHGDLHSGRSLPAAAATAAATTTGETAAGREA